jgi:hypothetical protein
VNSGGALLTALLVTLARPSTWVLALAAFLVRGGILVLCLPIIILPTPVGIANLVGPTLVDVVFGGISVGVVALALGGVGVLLGWLLLGGVVAAAAEVEGVRIVASDEEVAPAAPPEPDRPRGHGAIGGTLAIRLFTLAPLLVALTWGSSVVVAEAYRELTLPSDVTQPIVWRVVAAVPGAVVVILLAWVIGEILGARSVRRLVIEGVSVWKALRLGAVDAIRHPLESIILFGLPSLLLVLVVVPVTAATGVAWTVLRASLQPGTEAWQVIAALLGFVGLWLGGLALVSMAVAWRSAVWTVDLVRRGNRTFSAAAGARPGDWNHDAPSVTL